MTLYSLFQWDETKLFNKKIMLIFSDSTTDFLLTIIIVREMQGVAMLSFRWDKEMLIRICVNEIQLVHNWHNETKLTCWPAIPFAVVTSLFDPVTLIFSTANCHNEWISNGDLFNIHLRKFKASTTLTLRIVNSECRQPLVKSWLLSKIKQWIYD